MSLVLKDPASSLDYMIDWGAGYLTDDVITGSNWSILPAEADGITIDGSRFDPQTATVQVSGGRAGKVYRLLNHVVTSLGREDNRSILVRVEVR